MVGNELDILILVGHERVVTCIGVIAIQVWGRKQEGHFWADELLAATGGAHDNALLSQRGQRRRLCPFLRSIQMLAFEKLRCTFAP